MKLIKINMSKRKGPFTVLGEMLSIQRLTLCCCRSIEETIIQVAGHSLAGEVTQAIQREIPHFEE